MMELKKINDNMWEIPRHGAMKVDGMVFASEKLIEDIKNDKTLEQVKNVACLKGIVGKSLAMPDCHEGYGFCIGGVAAFDANEGIVSPGGVGYDINCSIRMLRTNIPVEEFLKKREEAVNELFRNVPTGVGKRGAIKLDNERLMEVLEKGAQWMVREGFGKKEDYIFTESEGKLDADATKVSELAMKRGATQLGSLGSGNHFLEVQQVEAIYDEKTANIFGIDTNKNITLMIHCGSRGLGHQVASDYIRAMEKKYGFNGLPDRELINAPIQSELGQDYIKAMNAAANFSFANKQMITHWVRESFNKVFGKAEMDVVYDVCHNIAKLEKHKIDGEVREVCVHRKGATRSFGAGREELPEKYRQTGQPVIIPGSMGTASYLLVGTAKAEEISFASTAHGAGRVMSRHEALRSFRGEQIANELKKKNIYVKGQSWKGIAEEAWQVYKDIDEVVRVSHAIGIGNLVAKVRPLGVIKG